MELGDAFVDLEKILELGGEMRVRGKRNKKVTVSCIEFLTKWISIIIRIPSMNQKQQGTKLSTQRLEPLPLDHLELHLNPSEELGRTVRTPRCSIFQKESQDICRTQKLEMAEKANKNREKLPSIKKGLQDLKENLLDLDLYFEMEPLC